MPASAYLLLAFFVVVSLVAGFVAWRIVAPGIDWGWLPPILAAFGALYLVGHRLGWSAGPTVQLFGFEVALLFDLAVAVVVAFGAAGIERVLATALPGR